MAVNDSDTTVSELQDIIREFCDERGWDQFHNSKDLAIGMVTEASELLELFRFKSDVQIAEMMLSCRRGISSMNSATHSILFSALLR